MSGRCIRAILLALLAVLSACSQPGWEQDEGSILIRVDDGRTLRVTAYGEGIVRLQSVRAGESFFDDDRYEMVESHDWPAVDVEVSANDDHVLLKQPALTLEIDRRTLAVRFFLAGDDEPVLVESSPVAWSGTRIAARFRPNEDERFTGLGHGFFGRAGSLDLRGQVIERNYGSEPIEQAPLIVPWYLSSLGYGVFLNSTFPNRFAFNANGEYGFEIDDHGFGGRMDYFFVAGPEPAVLLDRYTQLTGRPRLPIKSVFGLQLSDKGHDHTSSTPSDERWWKDKINEHRAAGFPLDHVVNDNRWRAGGGQRCVSRLEWDSDRYPEPSEWAEWLRDNGLTSTIDFNRCIARFSDGWNPEFNLPPIDNIQFADSAPDLTNAGFRDWFWDVFYRESLDPALGYPGDGLWIDEFDEQGAAPRDLRLANGRSSAEMRNYWFFLIAKALVQQGWDVSGIEQRPYVWVRGMTAGAQRYATLWSGDIYPNDEDMATQVRAMQLAGLSGFPYWGHDAGGFFDWDTSVGPDNLLYMRWAMALGSFSPIWKPHGMGQSRWPLDRTENEIVAARKYAGLRYQLMPYLYSAAHAAAESGLPIVRPMLLYYPDQSEAWERDLQYFWGPDLLVAPVFGESDVDVWLPPGEWYSLWDDDRYSGGQTLAVDVDLYGPQIPVFVRAGAVLPGREYALSTAFLDKTRLILDVYVGADGSTRLIEDDDRTEAYLRGERQVTAIRYDDAAGTLTISAAEGTYRAAPDHRDIVVNVRDGEETRSLSIDNWPVAETLVIELSDAL